MKHDTRQSPGAKRQGVSLVSEARQGYPAKTKLSEYTQCQPGNESLVNRVKAGLDIEIKPVKRNRPTGMIYCKIGFVNVHVCRHETCRFYPCKKNK